MLRKHGGIESSSFVVGKVGRILSGCSSCVVGVEAGIPNARDRQMSSLVVETGRVTSAGVLLVDGVTVVVNEVSMRCSLVPLGAMAAKLLHGSNT